MDKARPRSFVALEIQSHSGETRLWISWRPSVRVTRSMGFPDAPEESSGWRSAIWSRSDDGG
jgi:hypothetical protein